MIITGPAPAARTLGVDTQHQVVMVTQTTRNLITATSLDDATIAAATGLTEDQVRGLRVELRH